MSFFLQPLRPFEFTSPVYDRIKNPLLWLKPISSLIFLHPSFRVRFTSRTVNERILEIPFILRSLPTPPSRILDVGACESPLSLMLSSMGYKVTALDTRPYHFSHSHLKTEVADITEFNTAVKYDVIICLSVLEHIGLAVYGNRRQSGLDQAALKSMFNLLTPGGTLFLTTPVDLHTGVLPGCRVYTIPVLKKYLSQFSQVKISLGIRNTDQQWRLMSRFPVDFVADDRTPSAVALVTAVK